MSTIEQFNKLYNSINEEVLRNLDAVAKQRDDAINPPPLFDDKGAAEAARRRSEYLDPTLLLANNDPLGGNYKQSNTQDTLDDGWVDFDIMCCAIPTGFVDVVYNDGSRWLNTNPNLVTWGEVSKFRVVELLGGNYKQSNTQDTLDERGKRYGEFKGHALITQRFKQDMSACEGWKRLNDSQIEALEMIAHKIGRILNGDPNYADSWRDIAGYAQLIVNELESMK